MEHTAIPAGDIHAPYQWVVDDESARLAIVPESVADLHKLCLQLDTGESWRLAAITPPAWAGTQPATGGARTDFMADAALGGHRAVIRTSTGVDCADAGIAAHCGRVIGLTTGACVAGEQANVQMAGDIEEPSWNWTPELPVFVGADGLLTQEVPAAPGAVFSQVIGVAITPIKLFVQLRDPIALI
ncbi:MAG: hypothetical protein BWY57_01618 [Betaproteobacteria bacterium ADurb.Bin341]|nr:MAG: hypothetical protein BWY57_01618 [Betaproteobacteria bacterium ADurb.Bin341]